MTPSIVVALALLTGPPQGVAAPAPDAVTDDRWQPWLGCWRADDDRDGRGARTCVVPADGGVRIVTLVGAQVLMTETRVADDRHRPVAQDDCRGTERASWSSLSRRVYRTATVTCGPETPRTLSSVAFMIAGPTWVDVQSLQQDGQTRVRVTRYHPAGNQQLANGQQVRLPRPGAYDGVVGPWTVADVLEMQGALAPDAIQAAIGEGVAAFSLNRRSLTTLADAGVAERVIDLMVGLTLSGALRDQVGRQLVGGDVRRWRRRSVLRADRRPGHPPWLLFTLRLGVRVLLRVLRCDEPDAHRVRSRLLQRHVRPVQLPVGPDHGAADRRRWRRRSGPRAVARPRRQRPRLYASHAGKCVAG